MCYQTQMLLIFLILFSDIGQCFCPAQTKSLENQNPATLGLFRLRYKARGQHANYYTIRAVLVPIDENYAF